MYKFSKYKEQYKLNLKLAIPVVLSQLGHVVVQIADNIMVGQYGGDDPLPLAAVSFGSAIFMTVMVAAMGLTFGLTPVVGELYAQHRCGKVAKYLQNGIFLYTMVGAAFMILQFAFIPLMWHLGQPEDVVDAAIPYYLTMVATMLPSVIFFTFKQFLEGLGDTKTAMYCIVVSNAVNIFLNWILIYGHWGAPELGVVGAGLATLVSRVMMMILLVGYFFRSGKFTDYISRFSRVNFSRAHMFKLVGLGTPISAQIFMEVTTFTAIGFMMGWIGKNAMSANQIGVSLGNAAFMIALAIGTATTIRVSHCFGARNPHEMKLASMAAWHLGFVWTLFTAIFFASLSTILPTIYTSNAEVIEIASALLIFIGIFQIPDGIQCVAVGILRGMQDVKAIIPIAFVSYWLLNIPVGYLCTFVLGMGPQGLYIGYIFGLAMASILMIWRIKVGQKRLVRGER
ncbi:MAG: MATE family efflux transporter [Rikenellaceae bacterium]